MDAADHPALFLVDTISSLGSIDYRHDEWSVDVTVAGSQKGLMLPPGHELQRRQRQGAGGVPPRRAAQVVLGLGARSSRPTRTASGPTPPSTNLMYGLDVALDMLYDEGLENVFARHQRHAAATRAAVREWGLEVLCLDEREHSGSLDRGPHARGPRRRRAAPHHPRALRHVPRRRPDQARRQGLPHRPPRRLQRPDAGRHAVRRADGPAHRRRAGARATASTPPSRSCSASPDRVSTHPLR